MRLPLLLAALLLLASGCSGPGDVADGALDGAGGDGVGGSGVQPGAEVATVEEVFYDDTGLVAGAGPEDPVGTGQPWPVPPAKVGTFTVPDGALELDFEGGVCDGSGHGGIEVLSPSGEAVWRSDFALAYAGGPMVGCVGLYSAADGGGDDPEAGEYTVNYWIAGALTATVKVTAQMPAPVAAETAEE